MDNKKIISGIKWTSIQFAIDAIFRFSIRLILARLLFPEQFGLIGMASIFIAVASAASELGMGEALIQKENDDEAKVMYPTAFWAGLMWGVGLFLIMSLVVGPFAAYFYDEPILLKLVPALSIGILLRPLNLINNVILIRSMEFKAVAKILNISSFIAGILAITAAYFNFGVWALVVNSVVAVAISVPLFFSATNWIPKKEWNFQHFKTIFRFGAYSTSTRIFSTLTYNVDNLLIGKLLGASFLGSYTLAFSLTEQLRQVISSVLNKVMYPVFGKNQKNEEKLKNYFLKIINFNAIVIYPLMTFFLLFAEEIIIGFFGNQWEKAIVPLQILSIAMMVHLLVNSFASLLRGLGKPKLEMKIIMTLTIFILLPGLTFGIIYFGLNGAAYAILVNKIALAITGLIVLKKQISVQIYEVIKAIKGAVISVIVTVVVVLIFFHFTPINNVIYLAPLFIILYSLIIFQLEKNNLKNLLKILS